MEKIEENEFIKKFNDFSSKINKKFNDYITEEKPKNIEELLSKYNWKRISENKEESISYIRNFIDFSNKDELNKLKPVIKTNKKTIIVCDNKDFNETYVIDIVNKLLEKKFTKAEINNFNLLYIDSLVVRLYIKNPTFVNIYYENKNDKEAFENISKNTEKNILNPCVIVANPEINDDTIVMASESKIFIINENYCDYVLSYLDNEFVKNEISNSMNDKILE